ncbi:DUF6907 domain-containing protein [Kitasatospora sp. NPDC048239]|uniref:DUF6907 domain-containing protein n=1 Tax=Kitasatospora sp. NPDC048239 TaxID=3364046 RepID=UPI00371F145C
MPHCNRLAGHCTETGDHWLHYGPTHAIPAPPAAGHPNLVDLRLEEYEEGGPLLVLAWGGDTASLSPGGALLLAAHFVRFAARMVVAAVQLAKARRTA